MPDSPPETWQVTDFDELYPGRFLKAGLFHGKPVTLEIVKVHLEKLQGEKGPEKRGILTFRHTEMQLVLNRTNGVCMLEMFGRELPKWVGHKVTLYPGTWEGKPAIRVYGSPELAEDRELTITLPRRKPMTMILHAVRKPAKSEPGAAKGAAAPTEDDPF